MESNRIKLSLFGKFALGISFTVIVFGVLNAFIVRNSVHQSLNEEFEKRGYFIARALAEQAVSYILANDPAGLNMLINEIMAIDQTIYYAFVVNGQGEVLGHSFSEQVPRDLLPLNIPPADDLPGIITVRAQHRPRLLVRDFSMATMSKGMGIARVGILEHEIREQVAATVTSLLLMVALFLFLGLAAAVFFSYTIATPLHLLSRQSAVIDIRNIQAGLAGIQASTQKPYYRIRQLFGFRDEIDLLYENYTNMLQRLEQAYRDLNRMQQSLLQSEKLAAIGTLTAGVAHEISNPLSGIGIGLNRIGKNPENIKQIREYTALMQDALSRIEQVIQDLLIFSRKSEVEREAVNACELIKKVVKLSQYRAKSENIHFYLDDSCSDIELTVSPNRIEQVFLNIIINAIDSIGDKLSLQLIERGEIRIVAEERPGRVVLIFSDNGMGIPPEVIGQVFDPFFTTKDVGKGTGLGLSVSYQIVREHGGEISVESEADKGSRFFVVLPKHN